MLTGQGRICGPNRNLTPGATILIGRDDVRRWLAWAKDRWKASPAVDLDALGYSLLSSVVDQDPGIVHEMLQLEVPCIDTPQCTAPNRLLTQKADLAITSPADSDEAHRRAGRWAGSGCHAWLRDVSPNTDSNQQRPQPFTLSVGEGEGGRRLCSSKPTVFGLGCGSLQMHGQHIPTLPVSPLVESIVPTLPCCILLRVLRLSSVLHPTPNLHRKPPFAQSLFAAIAGHPCAS